MQAGGLVHVPSYSLYHSSVDCIAGPYHVSIKYPDVVDFGLFLRKCRHSRPTFVKFPWKVAGHIRSDLSKCLVPNYVALSNVLYVNFTHEIFKNSHFGFTNGF